MCVCVLGGGGGLTPIQKMIWVLCPLLLGFEH